MIVAPSPTATSPPGPWPVAPVRGMASTRCNRLGSFCGARCSRSCVCNASNERGAPGDGRDERSDDLAPVVVRYAHDRGVRHSGAAQQRRFDLDGGHRLAAGADQLLGSSHYREVSVLVLLDDVTRPVPAVDEHVGGGRVVVEVAAVEHRALHPQFAGVVASNERADLREADGVGLREQIGVVEDAGNPVRFCGPVDHRGDRVGERAFDRGEEDRDWSTTFRCRRQRATKGPPPRSASSPASPTRPGSDRSRSTRGPLDRGEELLGLGPISTSTIGSPRSSASR